MKLILLLLIAPFWLQAQQPQAQSSLVAAFSLAKPAPSSPGGLAFEDARIGMAFDVSQFDGFRFRLANKGEDPITLDWDQLSMVSPSGSALRLVHTGILRMDLDRPQAKSVIPPGATLQDTLFPSEAVRNWMEFMKGMEKMAFGSAIDPAKNCNKNFSLFMPLQVGEKKVNYNFQFLISCVRTSLLVIHSTPQDCELWLDGLMIGRTTRTVNLVPGGHLVEVRRGGYNAWSRMVKAADGLPVTLDVILAKEGTTPPPEVHLPSQSPPRSVESPNVITIPKAR